MDGVDREPERDFKALLYAVVVAGKSKIYRAG